MQTAAPPERIHSTQRQPELSIPADCHETLGLCDGFVSGEARGLSGAKPLSAQRLHDTNE